MHQLPRWPLASTQQGLLLSVLSCDLRLQGKPPILHTLRKIKYKCPVSPGKYEFIMHLLDQPHKDSWSWPDFLQAPGRKNLHLCSHTCSPRLLLQLQAPLHSHFWGGGAHWVPWTLGAFSAGLPSPAEVTVWPWAVKIFWNSLGLDFSASLNICITH